MTPRLRKVLALVVLALGVVQVSVAFARSLIPYEIDGTLEEVRTVTDSRQRLFDIRVDGQTYRVDNKRIADLRIGRHLHKDRWDTTLVLDGRKPVRLPVGDETFQFGILTLVAVTGTWLLTGMSTTHGATQERQIVRALGSQPRN